MANGRYAIKSLTDLHKLFTIEVQDAGKLSRLVVGGKVQDLVPYRQSIEKFDHPLATLVVKVNKAIINDNW